MYVCFMLHVRTSIDTSRRHSRPDLERYIRTFFLSLFCSFVLYQRTYLWLVELCSPSQSIMHTSGSAFMALKCSVQKVN